MDDSANTPMLNETTADTPAANNDQNSDEDDVSPHKLTVAEILVLIPILLVFVFMFMSYSSLGPFFPPEAAAKGVRGTIIGLIFSIYPAVMIFGCPIIGMLIPKVGSKLVFTAGSALLGSTYIIFSFIAYVEHKNLFIAACFIIRFIEGIAASCILTAFFSITMQHYTNHINYTFALQQIAIGIGSTVGPIIGGGLYKFAGFMLPFLVFGICIFLTIPFNGYCMPSAKKNRKVVRGGKSASIIQLFFVPEVAVSAFVVIGNGSLFGFLNPTLEPAVHHALQLSPFEIALLFPTFGASYAIMCFVWSHLLTKLGKGSHFMFSGVMLCSFIFLMLGPSPMFPHMKMKLWLLITLLVFLGCFSSLNLVPTLEMMKEGAIRISGYEDNLATYGLISGIWSSCMSIGECIGPAYGAALMEFHGFPIASSIQALICSAVGLLLIIFIIYNGTCRKENHVPGNNVSRQAEATAANNSGMIESTPV